MGLFGNKSDDNAKANEILAYLNRNFSDISKIVDKEINLYEVGDPSTGRSANYGTQKIIDRAEYPFNDAHVFVICRIYFVFLNADPKKDQKVMYKDIMKGNYFEYVREATVLYCSNVRNLMNRDPHQREVSYETLMTSLQFREEVFGTAKINEGNNNGYSFQRKRK